MRILHACPRDSFSGLEFWVLEMVKFQRGNGLDSRLIVQANTPLATKAREAQVPIYETPNTELKAALKNAAQDFDPQILHLHGTPELKAAKSYIAWQKWMRRKPLKVVLQFHIWISHRKRDPLHALEYSLIDEVWCSSGRARDSILENLPVNERRLRVVHYGRDIRTLASGFQTRDESRAKLNLPPEATIVGTVSRLDRGKGIGELVKGTVSLFAANPDLHLAIIGFATTDHEAVKFNKELDAYLAALPQSQRERIHMLGSVAESYRYLKAFDIFALPTYRECFSLALIEAQLAELPCLVTDSGGSPELVRQNKTGWLCQPESVESFHEALKTALVERSRWSSFGSTAAERIRKEFDSNITLRATITAYRELLALPKDRGSRDVQPDIDHAENTST